MEQHVCTETILWIAATHVSPNSLGSIAGAPSSVVCAADLSAALHLLQTTEIGAILITPPIPGYSAQELLREIRRCGHTAPAVIQEPNGASLESSELTDLDARGISVSVSIQKLREALSAAMHAGAENAGAV